MRLRPTLLAVVAAVLAQARPVSVPSSRWLFDRSDLVVIATPTGPTTDTRERFSPPTVPRAAWIGVETPFYASLVLKGNKSVLRFKLHHYRESATVTPVVNGFELVFFNPGDRQRSGSFLLFLVREQDGRYAPAGGQTDPQIKAVSKLPYAEPVVP